MLNAYDLIGHIRDVAREEMAKGAKHGTDDGYKLGRVFGVINGLPSILFDGETAPSAKRYSHLSTYRPVAGDRVAMSKIKGRYVILGKIGMYEAPSGSVGGGTTTLGGLQFMWVDTQLGVKTDSDDNFAFKELGGMRGPIGPAGSTGPGGPQGPQGERGSTGQVGPGGPKGDIGLTGPKGDIGPQGPQGTKGDPGLTGQTGPVGLTGPTGETGATGPRGDKGDIGLTGNTGAVGPKGDVGLTGSNGPKGDMGIQGEQGPIGPVGERGVQGSVGLTGARGATGQQGPPGVTGPQGPDGAVGPKGLTGESGITTPISGLFTLSGDGSNLYAYYADSSFPPSFVVDTNGDIYYVIPE